MAKRLTGRINIRIGAGSFVLTIKIISIIANSIEIEITEDRTLVQNQVLLRSGHIDRVRHQKV